MLRLCTRCILRPPHVMCALIVCGHATLTSRSLHASSEPNTITPTSPSCISHCTLVSHAKASIKGEIISHGRRHLAGAEGFPGGRDAMQAVSAHPGHPRRSHRWWLRSLTAQSRTLHPRTLYHRTIVAKPADRAPAASAKRVA